MAASCCSVADGILRRLDETVREVAVRRVTDGALRECASQKRRNARIQSSRCDRLDPKRMLPWAAHRRQQNDRSSTVVRLDSCLIRG
jgi:hypothetical protein